MKLNRPLNVAVVGAGFRSRSVYHILWGALADRGVRLVAVCDPVREHADAYASSLGIPAFYSLPDLVRARPMDACVVAAPNQLNYAISTYLSEHGIPHITETAMATTLTQARAIVRTAREKGVVYRVGEQFFRLPVDRLSQKLDATGFLGPIRRIISAHDHTGHHHIGRWVKFMRSYPLSVQAIEHTMPVAHFQSMAIRQHRDETFVARFYNFDDGRLVMDMTSNGKGLLGRYPRPGHTEWQGERGTLAWRAASRWNGPLHAGEGEVRYCSDRALATNGLTDEVYPIVQMSWSDLIWLMYINLPSGPIEYRNPFYAADERPRDYLNYYHAAVAEHILDFAMAVQGEGVSEFTPEDALACFTTEFAARESAIRKGQIVDVPYDAEISGMAAEKQAADWHRQQFGRDPLEVEGMLSIQVARG
jgi:predicted dehydrogenase